MHVLKELEMLTEKELLQITAKNSMSKDELEVAIKGVCLLTEIEKLKQLAMGNGSIDPASWVNK